jgi:hypothetical protein
LGAFQGVAGWVMAKIETKKIEDLLPDPNNLNKHTQRGHAVVENSIRRRGVGRGILAAGKNTNKPVILAGNLTHEKARDAGIDEVILVHTTGNQLVVTVRDDLDPTSAEAIALGIEDNESAKQSYNVDIDILAAVMADPAVKMLAEQDKMFGDLVKGMGQVTDDNYTRKIEAPIYMPKGKKPAPTDLFDSKRTKELLVDIEAAELPEAEKEFLRVSAQRHTVINFKRVADYYAHSDKPTQKLMEDSALVIIDFNRAIELGYVKLSEEIAAQFKRDYPDA